MEPLGLLRKVCFCFNGLATAFRYAQDLGQRCADFAHGLGEFFTVQQLTLSKKPLQPTSCTAKQFWVARAEAVADLRSACEGLRLACKDPVFAGQRLLEQIRVAKQSGQTGWEEDEEEDDNNDVGIAVASRDSVLPEGRVELAFGSTRDSTQPSAYITKLLAEVDKNK